MSVEPDGRGFSIRGVPPRACDEFSRRRAAIQKAADEMGVSTARGLEVATLATRDPKTEVWWTRGRAVGFGPDEAAELRGGGRFVERSIDVAAILFRLFGAQLPKPRNSLAAAYRRFSASLQSCRPGANWWLSAPIDTPPVTCCG